MKTEEMRYGVIYSVTNNENGKRYIGRTLDYKHRMRTHLHKAKIGVETAFYEDYRINPDCFSFEIIEDNVPEYLLNSLEMYYIEKYDSVNLGYNATRGGDAPVGPIKFSKKRNEKISKALKGKLHPSYGKHRKYLNPDNHKEGWVMV